MENRSQWKSESCRIGKTHYRKSACKSKYDPKTNVHFDRERKKSFIFVCTREFSDKIGSSERSNKNEGRKKTLENYENFVHSQMKETLYMFVFVCASAFLALAKVFNFARQMHTRTTTMSAQRYGWFVCALRAWDDDCPSKSFLSATLTKARDREREKMEMLSQKRRNKFVHWERVQNNDFISNFVFHV